ncbi:alpha/beta fold hydrolase [Novosphingobium colocasiae]|uniref:AB hydrolase-1 domain-containing protein n=1 Tax=Novosphingobium colocasiae TaxID=1256513 RepID=A0A918UGR8_9SPHN|nr:alpha/beta fold hydrolase [Novosphingobium colocasiae]GGZ05447.1 hypothetical protein GCM10011614_20540 [Novosphingobium colocasiae]
MPFLQIDGVRLYWKRDGLDHAPGLVLLNSIGTDMDLWEPVLGNLSKSFAILRLDARGHGASDAVPGDLTLARLAQDVLAVANAGGLARFSLAGVSLGGMIGMELALRTPDRLDKLALVCTSATMDCNAWADRVATVRSRGMAAIVDLAMGRFLSNDADRSIKETVRRQLLSMDPQGYAACGAAIRDMDLAGRIAAIAAPTLVVTGHLDTSTPLSGHGEYLLSHIPGARHVALEAAHLAPLEAAEALARTLTTFLKS